MSTSPPKMFTPRKRPGVNSQTPSQISTPKNFKKFQQTSIETPECFNNVLLETPKARSKVSRDKCDEIANLRVAIRIRPMNSSELATTGVEDVVRIKNNELIICAPKNGYGVLTDHIFQYDHIFWSVDEKDTLYTSQEDVFLTIGVPLLNSAFRGFNACLFAYGQTGSGKSYSMMGRNMFDCSDIDSSEYSGITPRFCRELFKRVSEIDKDSVVNVEVSYFEIYNEKIHDLLANPSHSSIKIPLKVREHPVLGPYIVDLTTHSVTSYEELRYFLMLGNKNRATAATVMNDFSSRSHSIFCIELGQCKGLDGSDNSRRSKVSLVDLAGSERLNTSSNNEERLKQGVYINKSLLTLGKCISALSDQRKGQFVPYRDSVLTWLLRESLGGNSLTSMLATISPASTHLEETLATLRYACQARSIVNRARINESPHDRLIRELRSEVERLKALRRDYERNSISSSATPSNETNNWELEDVKTKLSQTESRLTDAQKIWERRFMETKVTQMKELAEAEKCKAELESKVRILRTANDEVSMSPYRTNFLEELEGVLTNKENVGNIDVVEIIKSWCEDRELICTCTNDKLNIVDVTKHKHALVNLKNLSSSMLNNSSIFFDSLQWTDIAKVDKKLTKPEIVTAMNQIYKILSNLRPADDDNQINLIYARVNKLLQSFETALLNSVKNTKTVKWAP